MSVFKETTYLGNGTVPAVALGGSGPLPGESNVAVVGSRMDHHDHPPFYDHR